MKGIICNKTEFNELNKKIHAALKKNMEGYSATRWADINAVPVHQTTGELFFPVKDGDRGEIINRSLAADQRKRVTEIKKGDVNWFKKDEQD